MKTIFTVFNANGNLIASPEYQLADGISSEHLRGLLQTFRVGEAGHGLTLRAKEYLKSTPDADLLTMLEDALTSNGFLAQDTAQVLTAAPHVEILDQLNGTVLGEGAQALVIVAMGDSENVMYQIRHQQSDALVFSISADHISALPAIKHVRTAIDKVEVNLREWTTVPREVLPTVADEAVAPAEAKGVNVGVRLLTPADIQTMFSLSFPGFEIPDLDKVQDHPANVVAEILATYGEADSASNALSRDITPVTDPVPVKKVAPPTLKPEDFNYDRDRDELAHSYNVRFRGIILDKNNDPFEGSYMPHDVVCMEGALHYLNDKLVWVSFPTTGNGGSWRLWLTTVAGKRPVGGPGAAAEVEVPPAGKSSTNSVREELAKLAAPIAQHVAKSATTAVNATNVNPFYFIAKMGEVEEFRVVVRGVERQTAVEQGIGTFLSRELGAASLHAATSTFNLTHCLTQEMVIVATRTALQMLGLNAADIDVEPTFMPLNEEYVALMA